MECRAEDLSETNGLVEGSCKGTVVCERLRDELVGSLSSRRG